MIRLSQNGDLDASFDGDGKLVTDMLEAFNAAGVTCVISTHDERLLQGADRVVQLSHGRVIAMHSAGSEVGA